MQFSAAQIAALINGKLQGDPEVLVNNFGKIEEAQAETVLVKTRRHQPVQVHEAHQ